MHRTICAVVFLLGLAGCQLPAERLPVAPLPEEGPIPYADLVTRARLQAGAANEAFYVNKWKDLEEAATSMQKLAGYFGKAADVPERLKDKVPALAADLTKEAGRLREAAQMKDDKQANEVLQRINLKVREMRPEN